MAMKTCRTCASDIADAARKCPHCQSWQSSLAPGNPLVSWIALACVFFLVGILLWSMNARFKETQAALLQAVSPSHVQQDLRVLESSFQFLEREGSPEIVILGKLGNSGPTAWTGVRFHVEFQDASGSVIDVFSTTASDLVVPPQSQTTFRLTSAAARPRQEYVSHRIQVRYARRLR